MLWRSPEEQTTHIVGATQFADELKDIGGRLIAEQISQCWQYNIGSRLDGRLRWVVVVAAAAGGSATAAFI